MTGTDGPTREAVLEVTDLAVSFATDGGTLDAVRGMTYALAPGEVLGIVGESGAGKSVSALAVMGLLPPNARVRGSVQLRGRELLGLDDRALSALRGKGISMVFQDPLSALTPMYRVGDQIAEAVAIHQQVDRARAAERAVELLELVGVPDAARRARSFPHELSGGIRQRVVIAMAMANDPDVILADEPTTALDVTIQAQVLEVLRTAQEATGAAVVLITHDLGVVAGIADHVVVMYAGRPVERGTVDDVFARPLMPYTLGLLGSLPRVDAPSRQALTPMEGTAPSPIGLPAGCSFAPRCPLRMERCREVEPELRPRVAASHAAACHRSEEVEVRRLGPAEVFPHRFTAPVAGAPREHRPRVLEVRELVTRFPLATGWRSPGQARAVRAVDGASLDIAEGETLGLVGESGAGKTTLAREVLGLAPPMGGSVRVLGRDVAGLDARERRELRRHLAVVFQDPTASLDPRMPVGDTVGEGLRTFGAPRQQRARRVGELLGLVGLEAEHAGRYPQELSAGQCQRIALARALALSPRLVVLDEPVSALDVSLRAGMMNLLQQLKATLGMAYLFITHDLSIVRHVADRVAVMYLGRIVEVGPVTAVFDRPAHPYTRALLSAIPVPDPVVERTRRRVVLLGEVPDAASVPSGCRFHTRCPTFASLDAERRRRCLDEEPVLIGQGPGHEAACHHADSGSVLSPSAPWR